MEVWKTEDPRVNIEKRFAHYEVYTWTLCHSYLHEKQTSRIQSLIEREIRKGHFYASILSMQIRSVSHNTHWKVDRTGILFMQVSLSMPIRSVSHNTHWKADTCTTGILFMQVSLVCQLDLCRIIPIGRLIRQGYYTMQIWNYTIRTKFIQYKWEFIQYK